MMNITGSHLPRGQFFDLVKAIGEAKSKQEEDRIILEEMAILKQNMPTQATFSKKMKEYLVRLIYCEMLGHDASFGYIKAVELCASTNLLQKRVGYLAASLCLSPEHEFRFMLVNQFTRDMNSINYLEVCAALNAVCKLTTVDTIPAVINDVIKLLKHEQELVRKKAVMALQRFYSLQPSSIAHMDDKIRRALCDKDPSVMGAVLCLLLDLIRDDPQPYKDLVPSLVSILKQITDHRLPRDYDYHRIPAPWIQIHLLRILALLGNSDQKASEGMYEVLVDVMRRADTGINVGYAIVYECVRTVTTIYPNTVLLDAAASGIARFIGSDNHNLKYLGVKGLAAIVKDHPRYAAQHQLAVIDCLEDPDETLKRKTLDLLHRMTNPVNVEFITAKLLDFLRKATDVYLRADLVQRISTSAERFAPSTSWYIQTMTTVFLLAGELVKGEVAHTLMQLVAEGTGDEDDEAADTQLRREAVENYARLLDKPVLPDVLVQTMSWVLGEYGYLSQAVSQAELIRKLCTIAHRKFSDAATRGFVIYSVVKLVAQIGTCPSNVTILLELYAESIDLDLQQRCHEFLALLQTPSVMVSVLPVDASCEDLGVDESLSFLDAYVQETLRRGAKRYDPPPEHDEYDYVVSESKDRPALKLTPYAKPEKPAPVTAPAAAPSVTGQQTPQLPSALQQAVPPAPLGGSAGPGGLGGARGGVGGLRSNAQIWSRQGMVTKPTEPQHPAPSSQPAAVPLHQQPQPLHGSAQAPAAAPKPAEPERPRELTEKEKMAQALFGGLGGSASGGGQPARAGAGAKAGPGGVWGKTGTPPRTTGPAPPPPLKEASGSTQQPATEPARPARAPAPSVDLLDLGDLDAPPQTPKANGTAAVPSTSSAARDLLSLGMTTPAVPGAVGAPAKAVTVPSKPVDPFAALSEVSPELAPPPPPSLRQPSAFLHNGSPLRPLAMKTPDFGAKWTQMRFQSPSPNCPTTLRTLELLSAGVASGGLHVVEAIARTSEVIAAGQLGSDSAPVLVHIKLHAQRGAADVTVRCNDNTLGQAVGNHLKRLVA